MTEAHHHECRVEATKIIANLAENESAHGPLVKNEICPALRACLESDEQAALHPACLTAIGNLCLADNGSNAVLTEAVSYHATHATEYHTEHPPEHTPHTIHHTPQLSHKHTPLRLAAVAGHLRPRDGGAARC